MLRGQKLVPDLEEPSLGCALTTHMPLGGPGPPFGLSTLQVHHELTPLRSPTVLSSECPHFTQNPF